MYQKHVLRNLTPSYNPSTITNISSPPLLYTFLHPSVYMPVSFIREGLPWHRGGSQYRRNLGIHDAMHEKKGRLYFNDSYEIMFASVNSNYHGFLIFIPLSSMKKDNNLSPI